MIHETLDINTEPLLTPEAVYGKHEKICDVCVITFSYKVIEWALRHLDCEQAAEIGCANGNRPIYLTIINVLPWKWSLRGCRPYVSTMVSFEMHFCLPATVSGRRNGIMNCWEVNVNGICR